MDIEYLIDWAAAVFNKATIKPDAKAAPFTKFSKLTGSAQITNGTLVNKDLVLKADHLNLSGAGQIYLPDESLKYRMQAQLLNLAKDSPLAKIQEALGGSFPFLIRGTFDNLRAEPDTMTIIKGKTKQFLTEQFENILKDTKNTSEKTKELLEKIF